MNKIINFVKEAWVELKLVSWLTVPQMVASTWLVVILVMVLAVYIFGVDKIIQSVFKLLV